MRFEFDFSKGEILWISTSWSNFSPPVKLTCPNPEQRPRVISARALNYDVLVFVTHVSHCISQSGRLLKAKHKLCLWVLCLWRLDVDSWISSIWCLLIQNYVISTAWSSDTVWLVNLQDEWCVQLSESVMLLCVFCCLCGYGVKWAECVNCF